MAELTTRNDRSSGRAKHAPRLDLTPMVDLMFLLITFFMLTTTLAKPSAMDIAMPLQDEEPIGLSESRTMTICIGHHNQIQWYMGTLEDPLITPALTSFGADGIRKALLRAVSDVEKITGSKKKGLVVLVKPSSKAVYKNVVDIIDELQITKVPSYSIVDISDEEIQLMKMSGIY